MSVNIVGKNNPIVLLDNYNIQREKVKSSKKLIDQFPISENAYVCLTHFHTLFKNKCDLKDWKLFFCVNTTSDIIHSTVGLFDICLPDMDLNTIYNSTVEKEAFTIIMFSSKVNAIERSRTVNTMIKDKSSKINKIKEAIKNEKFTESLTNENDIFIAGEEDVDDFKLVYDDIDSEDESVEDDDDESSEEESDFSQGYNSYIRGVFSRKLAILEGDNEINDIGLEGQMIGAISFKVRHVDCRRIVHVTLLAVHKRYRKAGVGRHLVNLVLSPKIVGSYEAVVVHADFNACDFFKKFGFSDDSLLNTQWHSLEPEYTNCSLLTFVPPYSGKGSDKDGINDDFSAIEMDVDIRLWQKKAVELHCYQFQAFQRMKMEIRHLKETINNQDKMMKLLMTQLRDSNKEKARYERFLKGRVEPDGKNLSEYFAHFSESDDDAILGNSACDNEIELKVRTHFNKALECSGYSKNMFLISFTRATSVSVIHAEYQATKRSIDAFLPRLSSKMASSAVIMYFCEPFSLSQSAKKKIPSEGFSKSNRKPGSHGNGFYFATNPATAAIYCSTKTIIVAEVTLGKICSDPNVITPLTEVSPTGYNSVLVYETPQRQSNNSATDAFDPSFSVTSTGHGQEYVIFDAAQALPLGSITYTLLDS